MLIGKERFIRLLVSEIVNTCHNYLGVPNLDFTNIQKEQNPNFMNNYKQLWVKSLLIIRYECFMIKDELSKDTIDNKIFTNLKPVLHCMENIAVANRNFKNEHLLLDGKILYPLNNKDIEYIMNYQIPDGINLNTDVKLINFIYSILDLSSLLMNEDWSNQLKQCKLPDGFKEDEFLYNNKYSDKTYLSFNISLIYLLIRNRTYYIYKFFNNENNKPATEFYKKIDSIILKSKIPSSFTLEEIRFLKSL
jgi:hypothetical protein